MSRQAVRFVGDCEFCSKPIRGRTFVTRVEGWTESRRQGGANQIRFSKALGYAHPACLSIAMAQPGAQQMIVQL